MPPLRPFAAVRAGRAAALACVAVLAACADPLQAPDVAGLYTLREIAGEPLPAVGLTTASVIETRLADTLVLDGDGTGRRIVHASYDGIGSVPDEGPTRWERPVAYRIVDGRVWVELVCGPTELCSAPPHLVLERDGDVLRAVVALGERVPQRFERVVERSLRRVDGRLTRGGQAP